MNQVIGMVEGKGKLAESALRLRQEGLLARARSLREHMGAPEDRLAELLADLPPDDDEFWVEVQEPS